MTDGDLAAKGKALLDSGKYEPEHNGHALEDGHHEQRKSDRGRPEDDPPTLLGGMFNGAWLDTQEFPPLEYAVPGIIPEGLGLFVGPPKLGKSWLVCGIGLASAAGGIALGAIRVRQRPVLYLALEDGPRRLQSRCRRLMFRQSIPAGIHFVTKAKPSEVIGMICEFLHRHRGEKPLIIVDTLGKARPPRPAGVDPYQWDYAVGSRLKEAVDTAPGASLLLVHHARKAESVDFVDSVSGTQGIAGSADFVLVLSRKRHENEALLNVTGRDVAEAEYALTTDAGLWSLDGKDLADAAAAVGARAKAEAREASRSRRSDTSNEALDYVESQQRVTPAELAEWLDIDPVVAGNTLARLYSSGLIDKAGRGVYKPVKTTDESDESDEKPGQAPEPDSSPPSASDESDETPEPDSSLSSLSNGADETDPTRLPANSSLSSLSSPIRTDKGENE